MSQKLSRAAKNKKEKKGKIEREQEGKKEAESNKDDVLYRGRALTL